MKIIKTASGKQIIRMSKKEWMSIGKKAGWTKEAMWPFTKKEPQVSTQPKNPINQPIDSTCVKVLLETWFPKILQDIEYGNVVLSPKASRMTDDFSSFYNMIRLYLDPKIQKSTDYYKKTGKEAVQKIEQLQTVFQQESVDISSLKSVMPILERVKTYVNKSSI